MSRFRARLAAIDTEEVTAIPDGALLYTCTFTVLDRSRLPTAVRNRNDVAFGLDGRQLAASGFDGLVTHPLCTGDCNGDGVVTVGESLTTVTIPLGNRQLSVCHAADREGNGQITINVILAAVNNAQTACPQ